HSAPCGVAPRRAHARQAPDRSSSGRHGLDCSSHDIAAGVDSHTQKHRHASLFFFSSRRRHTRSVSAFLLNRSSDLGIPAEPLFRSPAPVEFIAAVIAYYVHPVNIQTACLIMEGAEFTENIINGVERPVKAAELFAF